MLTSGMDCRIGTPNKHLSSADNELKNPLYATGIGLVMKGIEKYERESKRGINFNKPELVEKEETVSVKEAKKITNHSQKKIGSFFDTLITRAKDWMSDDIE